MDVANFDKSGEFGDEEDITFKEEEIALNSFEISFVTWVSVSARRVLGFHLLIIMKMNRPLEAPRTNDLLAC